MTSQVVYSVYRLTSKCNSPITFVADYATEEAARGAVSIAAVPCLVRRRTLCEAPAADGRGTVFLRPSCVVRLDAVDAFDF